MRFFKQEHFSINPEKLASALVKLAEPVVGLRGAAMRRHAQSCDLGAFEALDPDGRGGLIVALRGRFVPLRFSPEESADVLEALGLSGDTRWSSWCAGLALSASGRGVAQQ